MSNAVQMKGLWIPDREQRRYSEYGEVDGILDLDVRKTSVAVQECATRKTALDIGAHIGATAKYLSKHFLRVEAFEAIPDTFDFLKMNTDGLENVGIHNVAAADAAKDLYFEYLETHTQLSHVISGPDSKYYEGEKSQVIGPIPAKALDEFHFLDVSFIKIDVEGTELDVVRGLERTILTNRPVILMEQGKNEAKYHHRKEDEGTDFLFQLGMRRIEDFPFKNDRLFTF